MGGSDAEWWSKLRWPPQAQPRWPGPPESHDAIAGVSVALILVPQALAYAVLAGMPPRTGVIVAGVAAIAAAPFVSARLLQTGPTAITSLLTFGTLSGIAATGTGEYVALAALLAVMVGLIRIAVGLFEAGEVAYLISQPVLAGFTSAAAIVIAASQLPKAIGSDGQSEAVVVAAWEALSNVGTWDVEAIAMAAITMVLMLGGKKIHPLFPGVLIAVVGGVIYARTAGYEGELVGGFPTVFPVLDLDLPLTTIPDLVAPALIIALVGFSEASAIARNFAQSARMVWDPDREFVSQGIANLASGIFGGFPAGASFSRSALNRAAGATTPWSGMFTGLAVLAALPFAAPLESLPLAVLAGIIIGAVLSLMDPRPFLQLRHYSNQQFLISVVTFVLTLVFAPRIQWAVLVGIVLTVGAHLRRERKLAIPYWQRGETLHLRPVGILYFGSVRRLEAMIRRLSAEHPEVKRLVVHFDAVGRTDVTGALALRTLFEEIQADGTELQIVELTPTSEKIIRRVLEDTDLVVTLSDARGEGIAPDAADDVEVAR
ncbi:MAG: SulP family inorganic anion transporter [Nitriliruptorales bacterium]|nr:SulP family inorganic anion transporter [Nitriliruptorales bacterium]